MKQLFISAAFLLHTLSLIAQNNVPLKPVADLLFKNVKTKLTVAEKNSIATQLGFIASGNKQLPFALDKDSKDYPFGALVMPTDMNKDGKEEIFILFGNGYTSGNTGSSIMLYIKNAAGTYVQHLGFPGMAPDVLTTANLGYADLLIGGPGFEFPVMRWNGKTYANHRSVKNADYEKLKKTSLEAYSKTYQESIQ
ncbi:MAG: hypothetical protein ACOVP7_00560 [Lacibacter sp.]